MPTRTGYPGTISAGNTITAANNNNLPGGAIGYDEPLSSKTTSSTTELDLCSTSPTVGANRMLRITFYTFQATCTVAADAFFIRIYYDGTTIQRMTLKRAATATEDGFTVVAWVPTTSSGTKVIKATAQRNTGTGTINFPAGAADASYYILVEDMGPSF